MFAPLTRLAPAGLAAALLTMPTLAAAADVCPAPVPVQVSSAARKCSDSDDVACPLFNPTRSDRCAAEARRSSGVAVDYSYFGRVDCRTNKRKQKVRNVVIHDGGDARGNTDTWQCRKAASHYTIDRDGAIYQHVGEELVAWHTKAVNAEAIGIELEIRRAHGTTCNSLHGGGRAAKIAQKLGVRVVDVYAEMCAPTPTQLEALRRLIADIRTRHPIADDGVIGHCEVEKANGHGDPRALDWAALGLPARHRRAKLGACDHYALAALQDVAAPLKPDAEGRPQVALTRGREHGVTVGDRGYLWRASPDQPEVRYVVTSVQERGSVARLDGAAAGLVHATTVATFGAGGPVPAAGPAKQGERPSLGSCEQGFTYHRGGTIAGFTTGADGFVDKIEIAGAGWRDRVCDDSTGMIHAGALDDAFVVDAGGTKVRLEVVAVQAEKTEARVIEGRLAPSSTRVGQRVVLRKKK